jgi:TnpA family transposase
MKMELNEAKKILKENDYLVESDNYVNDCAAEAIESINNIIIGLDYIEKYIDSEQILKHLSNIKTQCEDTKKILRTLKTNVK